MVLQQTQPELLVQAVRLGVYDAVLTLDLGQVDCRSAVGETLLPAGSRVDGSPARQRTCEVVPQTFGGLDVAQDRFWRVHRYPAAPVFRHADRLAELDVSLLGLQLALRGREVGQREAEGEKGRTLELFGRDAITSSPFWLLFHSLFVSYVVDPATHSMLSASF